MTIRGFIHRLPAVFLALGVMFTGVADAAPRLPGSDVTSADDYPRPARMPGGWWPVLPAPPTPPAIRPELKDIPKDITVNPAPIQAPLHKRSHRSAPGADSGRRTLVLYDTGGLYGWLGESYAVLAGNLVSHNNSSSLPNAFLDDVLEAGTPVAWMHDNIWRLAARSPDFEAVDKTFADAPDVVAALRYMQDRGGTLVMHGSTHQYDDVPNPHNGVSGDDFEFYRVVSGEQSASSYLAPVAEDSRSWATNRIRAAERAFRAAGLRVPRIFEFPHNAGSAVDYTVVNDRFAARYDQGLYAVGWCRDGDCGSGAPDYSRNIEWGDTIAAIYSQSFLFLARYLRIRGDTGVARLRRLDNGPAARRHPRRCPPCRGGT